MSSLAEFAEKEDIRIEADKQKYAEENKLPGFFNMEEGENHFQILDDEPRQKEFNGQPRKIFRIKLSTGEERDWLVNPRNPIYSELIKKITEGKRAFVIMRHGFGLDTRYTILDKTVVTSSEQEQ